MMGNRQLFIILEISVEPKRFQPKFFPEISCNHSLDFLRVFFYESQSTPENFEVDPSDLLPLFRPVT